MFRRISLIALSLAATFIPLSASDVSVAAGSDPCATYNPHACFAGQVTSSQVTAAISAAHSLRSLPTTNPTLSFLSNVKTGTRSYFMPAGRCAQDALQTDGSPPSIADCTLVNPKGAHTVVLTGDSRAVMWTTDLVTLARQWQWRLVVLAKPGCVAMSGSITHLNTPGGPAWTACDKFHTAVASDLQQLNPELVIIASNPVQSLAPGQSGNAYSNSLSYFTSLKTAAPRATVIQLNNMPNVRWPGSLNPVGCLSMHKSAINVCDKAPVSQGTANSLIASADAAASVSSINIEPWVCDSTCPPVISGMIPYDRDGMHLNNVYSGWLLGVLWSALAAVPHSGVPTPS